MLFPVTKVLLSRRLQLYAPPVCNHNGGSNNMFLTIIPGHYIGGPINLSIVPCLSQAAHTHTHTQDGIFSRVRCVCVCVCTGWWVALGSRKTHTHTAPWSRPRRTRDTTMQSGNMHCAALHCTALCCTALHWSSLSRSLGNFSDTQIVPRPVLHTRSRSHKTSAGRATE